jgi:hypothetical protein
LLKQRLAVAKKLINASKHQTLRRHPPKATGTRDEASTDMTEKKKEKEKETHEKDRENIGTDMK